MTEKTKLSERIRPGSEAAPWVVLEIKEMEKRTNRYEADLEVMHDRIEIIRRHLDDLDYTVSRQRNRTPVPRADNE